MLRGYGVIRIVYGDVQVTKGGDRNQDRERNREPSSGMLSEERR